MIIGTDWIILENSEAKCESLCLPPTTELCLLFGSERLIGPLNTARRVFEFRNFSERVQYWVGQNVSGCLYICKRDKHLTLCNGTI